MPIDLVGAILCEFCLADNELRLEVQERGTPVKKCPICQREGGRALFASDPRVRKIFRALIRLNFSEWAYNGHVGGEELERLVFESQAIFNLSSDVAKDAFEDAYLAMEEKDWYPTSEEKISLGGGYWHGRILDGLRDRRDTEVECVVDEALKRNWFEMESAARVLIESLRNDLTTVISAGAEFYRGRIGSKARLAMKRNYLHDGRALKYLPFSGKEIDRPPLKLATEGRFNRARVSLLYLASNVETAVAELRPHPGHFVSTAKFRLNRDLRVANFAKHDIRNFLSDSRLEELRRILSIADVLNVPVQPEHRVLYAATQLFADALRSEGFEGITYKSSLGAGTNLACFVDGVFEMVKGSEGVQDVISLQYQISSVEVAPQDYNREQWLQDDDSPLGTLLHGMARQYR